MKMSGGIIVTLTWLAINPWRLTRTIINKG